MGRDDDTSFCSSFFGRLGDSHNSNSNDDHANSSRPSFGFNSSFSTSGSISASTSSSLNQPDSNSSSLSQTQTSKSRNMFGPFDLEMWWPDRSPAALALSSQYSPLNLHYLSQPVPRDAPPNIDASIFTFEDAFEDLLAVSQGQQLPDINARYGQRKLLRSMFPEGEPAYFWLRRLKSQGLLEIPEPSQFVRQAESNWDQFHHELDRRASNVWRAVIGEDNRDSRDVYQDADNFPENIRERAETSQRRQEPDHFDDFFSSIRSSFSESQSSWDNFVKSFHDGPSDKFQQGENHKKNQEVIKDEYVDRFGYLHSKVTVKTLDEEGNQIGSQTHYTVRPAEKEDGEPKPNGDDKSGIHASGKVETKAGWFWK
ncbi:hypothetical protein B0T10DRAFT_482520 [Thelonectria olida]|uniref:Uncharacterized protein n=1 Tax=Thelonectria olida TaxID=1576542 RepID=A0A9P8WC60_9HYPO|nr:hypothetical protein B0T10DRAFT_482520 [Thelonectria olida]